MPVRLRSQGFKGKESEPENLWQMRPFIGAFGARFLGEMRNVLLVILVVGALGYYFDFSPTDLLPSLPNNGAARERVRRAPAAPEQTPATAPRPSSTAIVPGADGSLANRWNQNPSASPGKP